MAIHLAGLAAGLPDDEPTRIAALHALRVLDTPAEQVYDDIVLLAAQICGTPVSLVSLIDSERQWFKARVGVDACETHRDIAFCAHAIASSAPLFVVEDAALDARFADNPFVAGAPHVRFYAGAPIVLADGQPVGTVCVVDTVPRTLDPAQGNALQALSRQVSALFELRLRTIQAERQAIELEQAAAHIAAERQRSRSALERSAELLQRMGSLAEVGGWELDLETGKVSWTEEVYRIHEVDTGTDPALLAAIDFYAPEARPVIRLAVENASRHGTPYDLELPFITASGRPRVVRTQGEALMQGGRAVRLFGTFRDITDSKRTEQALQRSEERLTLALSGSRRAVFDFVIATGCVYRGEGLSVWRGGPALETRCMITDVRALIHPADLPAVDAAIGAALRGESDDYDVEHRIHRLDGTWLWLRAVGRITARGPDGLALRISGIDEDVSARIAAAQALLDTQRRLRLITDNLPSLITHVDRDERYLFMNAYIGRLFGLDTQAALGRTMREVGGESTYALLAPHAAKALRGEATSFDYTEQAGGRAMHFRANYIPDIDANGRADGFYAMTFDITELHETQQRLEALARVDALTGLPNRRQFDERIADAMQRSSRSAEPMAVLCLDIDHFKSINDSLGHAAGDAVLCEFARRLKACVRATDTVARLGGDEFVVLLEGIGSAAELNVLADKVVACVRPHFVAGSTACAVTTSIGVATYAGDATSITSLLARADAALYRAKQLGRDRFELAVAG